MNIRDRRALRESAAASVANASDALKGIVLIYLAIITALTLAGSVLTVLLSDRIAETGGLSGMGLRSILSTAQMLLPWLQAVVFMALQIGYCNVAMRVGRGEGVSRNSLFFGFRRFFPLLRATLLQGAVYFCLGMMSMYVSVYIFLMLPVSAQFREMITPLIEEMTVLSSTITLDEATLMESSKAVMPAIWIFMGLYFLVALPTYYNFRVVMYRLVDQEPPRAFLAIRESRVMMRRNRFALLKLDLSLWWYYGLQLLIPLVCYGDLLLPLLGIELPIPEMASYFLFLVLSLALQAAVYYFFFNRVAVTYALAYDALLGQAQKEAKEKLEQLKARFSGVSGQGENN